MTRLEFSIAWRYLRSRRGSRLLSLISVIAIGGVLVGVSALIVINGVMTGMQTDLREKILVGSPDLRVLTFGDDLVLKEWQPTLARVRHNPSVVAAAPFVLTQGLATANGLTWTEAVGTTNTQPDYTAACVTFSACPAAGRTTSGRTFPIGTIRSMPPWIWRTGADGSPR